MDTKGHTVPIDWLVEKLTSDDYRTACRLDLESHGLEQHQIVALMSKISDQPTARWIQFIGEKKDGDELWRYRSSPDSWADLCGSAGFALVRSGAVVATLNTARS